jgi:16S rRNA (guanine527-N7)-methyltransferase
MKNAWVSIDEQKLRALVLAFLLENAKLNLSAFRSPEHCWIGNVLDSLSLLDACKKIRGLHIPTRLLDIGTGGGFPLLPLALSWPDCHCVGIDATAKKIDAVGRIVQEMDSKNVELLCGRSEELAHQKELRGSFDLVVSRAVAPLSVILEYSVPFLKVGGHCVFWKSSKIADELASSASAQRLLHTSFVGTYEYELPEDWGKRLLVVYKKNAGTPAEYPRENGIPKAKPL